jgi:hypothetical protein
VCADRHPIPVVARDPAQRTPDRVWLIEQCGDDLFLFSSDHPHPEGTKDPIRRFEETLVDVGDDALDRFYRGNYAGMMGWA